MNWFTMLSIMFLVHAVCAEPLAARDKSGVKNSQSPAVVAEVARKESPLNNLSGIDARLRVEGATFRAFKLYLAPIKLAGASKEQEKTAKDIKKIIERDLGIVGGFTIASDSSSSAQGDRLLKQRGLEGVSRLALNFKRKAITASIEHKNLITGKSVSKNIVSKSDDIRRLSHLIAQSIYEHFIGAEDIFSLQFAAIKRAGSTSQLVIMDFDGQNEDAITTGPWMKSSPYFSPNGKSVFYTVISPSGQGIVEQVMGKKNYQFRIKKPGLNIDARVLPDNSGLLATLSFASQADIYQTDRQGKIIGKLTNSLGLNLSPSVSADGKEVVFVSSRSGDPQIYVQPLSGTAKQKATRLTFKGKYNQTPHFSPNGQVIAFTGRDENNVFDIFLIERQTGRISRVTQNQGRNQEPFFSSSGRFIVFSSSRDGKSKADLFLSSLNGDHQVRLTNASAEEKTLGYFSPIVRPKQ